MTKQIQAFVLSVIGAALLQCANATGQGLAPIGRLPQLDTDWEISADDHQSKTEAKSSYRWVVFRNKRTGDFLSFATHPELGKNRELVYMSDTSLEIFPSGRPVWTQQRDDANIIVVKIDVVDVGRTNDSLKGEKVLEYCFISESPDHDNLMAQGRTWVGSKGAVFVQHTSAKPITSDLVDQTIKSIIQDLTRKPRSIP